ncbi:hypothetical protein LTR36_008105 [Oleoguttula mirabilis]|uniref:NAD(P)-binding protein n=1 Tax=Oleoguttula mirabilis TaxID=1507867 RepID=A0AAV9J8D3_9PEZI|nr:hypothetical protein LTR36_008105 [Oleoguttula mirabilis]
MTNPKVVIVTGANRGIGRAICNLILARPNVVPLKLFATSRKGEDLGLTTGGGVGDGRQVLYPKLDISSRASIEAFAGEVERQHGSVDVLINNAGVNLDADYGYENARRTLDVNYRGTLDMCRTFVPLLAKNGRIVNVSSVASSLKPYSDTIQHRFRNPHASLEDLNELAEEYLSSVHATTEAASGFGPPQRSYSISKGLVNAFTARLARDNADLTCNACCPGWIATDMGRLVGSSKVQPPKTAEQGARIPVRLAFDELGGVTGRYWANASIRGKGEGEVQEW